jgi:hypothetical protein
MRLPFTKPKVESGQAASDIETVRAKLARCQEETQSAEAELRRTALTAVLRDEQSAFEPSTKLQALRSRKEVLEAALQEAERVETERLAGIRSREQEAKRRALAQHSGRLAREAKDVTAALVALQDAQQRLIASGQSIIALLPSHLRNGSSPFHEFLEAQGLSGAIAVESYRLKPEGPKPRPGFEYEDRATGTIQPMTDRLAALVAQVREDFDPPPTKPKPVSPPPVVVLVAGDGDVAPSSIIGDVPASVADDRGLAAGMAPPRVPTSGKLTGVAVSLRGGQQTLTELSEPFVPSAGEEASAGEPAEGPIDEPAADDWVPQGVRIRASGHGLRSPFWRA